MRTNRVLLDDLGGLGIFGLMSKALTFLPPESTTSERHADAPIAAANGSERALRPAAFAAE